MTELKHLGCIVDGNRRFSKRLMAKPWMGHEWGAKKMRKFLEWCKEYGIREVTLFAFSLENFDRPKEEFDYLMGVFEREFKRAINDPDVYKDKIRFRFIGRIEMFPKKVYDAMKELMEKTKDHDKFFVNFAMAYSGRAEIVDAAKKLFEKVKDGEVKEINEEEFSKCIYMNSDPDLIIRTSETRLSGFLLWQSSYSELIFLPNKLWPEFSKEDFVWCIEEFNNRQRRFGK